MCRWQEIAECACGDSYSDLGLHYFANYGSVLYKLLCFKCQWRCGHICTSPDSSFHKMPFPFQLVIGAIGFFLWEGLPTYKRYCVLHNVSYCIKKEFQLRFRNFPITVTVKIPISQYLRMVDGSAQMLDWALIGTWVSGIFLDLLEILP